MYDMGLSITWIPEAELNTRDVVIMIKLCGRNQLLTFCDRTISLRACGIAILRIQSSVIIIFTTFMASGFVIVPFSLGCARFRMLSGIQVQG